MRTLEAKPLAEQLIGSSPARHVPGLLDAMTMAEAEPAADAARSQAWAERRVQDLLTSPAEGVYHSCFPADPAAAPNRREALQATIGQVLKEPAVAVAVLDLHALGRKGGVLDVLAGSGLNVQGPEWRR